jgi:hypothetical protein
MKCCVPFRTSYPSLVYAEKIMLRMNVKQANSLAEAGCGKLY